MPASPGRTSAHVVDALLAEQDGRPTVGPGSGSLRTESPAGAERRTLLVDTDRARRRAPSAAVALMLFAILAAAPVLGQNATGEPTISGVHRVGEELTASTAAIADPEGVANATFAYQWVSVDASATEKEIDGATSLTYTLAGADEGGTVKVKVSFTDDGGNTEERTSAAFPESESVYVCDLPAHHASMGTALLTAKLTIGNFVDFIYGYEPDVSIGGLSADTFELPTSNTSVAVESLTYHPDSTDPPNSFVVEFETAATYDELSELAFVVCEDVLPLRFSVLGDVSGNPQLTASRALDWASSLRPVRPIRVYHDRVAPTFVSAIVDGTDLIVEFGELLDERSVPEVGSFDIKSVVGGEVALLGSHLDGVSVSGRTVRLTSTALVSFAAGADRLLVSYREPPLGPLFDGTRILDLQANPVDSFTDQPVRIVAPPTQESAALAPDGRTLVLTFNESLDETSVPAADAFRVKVEGAQVELAASDLVTVVGSAVELRLAEPAGVGESVTASYTKPGTGPIRDTQGDGAASEAASFADFPVENRSTQAAPLPGLAVPGARVLLDTTLTVGRYDDPTTVAEGDFFGYADAAEIADLDAVAPGALGDATFEFGGVEYTVERLTVSGTPGSAEMAATIGDADGTALPDTAAVGIEFGTSAAGHAVLVDWRRFSSDETALAGVLGDVYAGAVGAMLPLRILALEVPDLWSATVTAWGTRTTDGVQAGTLSSTTFTLDGTSYAVDRLANFDGVSPAELEFSTTPDPPDGVRLALASRASATEAIGGLVDYYPLMTAHRPADAAVDRRWPLVGDLAELGTGNAVYLTRDTGLTRTGAVWSTTVTPAEEGRLLGYRRPGVDIGGFGDGQAAGVGSIAPDAKIALDGVDYTVNAIAFTSDSTTFTTFDDFWVHTTPTLPAGTGFGFEVGQKDGTAYYWAGVAGASRGGRVWKLVSSANAHGWDDDSDSDGTLDPRRVRLVRGLAPASMRVSLSVSPAAVAEGATVTATVTAMLDLAPRATDTAVAVTVGAAGDTAVSGTDYAAVGPFALTIPAGRRSASTTFSVSVIDNAETERAESLTVAGTATGVAVAGTRVTIPYNDYGTYLSATLTAAGLGGATGYGPANGALNNTRFGCCVSATGDEVAYTVDLLLTSTTPASVPELAFRYGDLAAAPPDDVLVLHVGGATAPLDAALGPGGAGYRSSNVRRWPLADIGLAPFAEGAAVPVRLTGPKHPRIASVDVVSSAPSNNGTVDVYAVGDVLRIAVGYDEPVAVTGTPTLAFRAETADSTATDYSAAYVEAESTATELVFAYTVAATTAASADVVLLDDTDGTAAGAQSPLSGGSIRSVEARSTRAASRFMPAGRKVTGQTLDGTDSTPAAATVGVDGPAAAAEGDGNVAYAVRLSRAAATERTVGYAFTGTATHATDYASSPAAMSGTLTFAAGRTFKRIMAILADDTVDEADETIVLTLSSPSTGLTLDTDRASVTTTVTDDDLPTVSLAAPPLAGTIDPYLFEFEASKSYSGTVHADAQADLRTNSAWTLTRAGLTDAALDVTVSVAETGEGEFVEADDETTHTVTFEATKTTAYFKIVADDADNERHGSVTATLLEGADYDVTGAASSTVAIRDDDGPLVRFAPEPADRTVGEGRSASFAALLTTVDDGPQAGTFTLAADIGRALRKRAGADFGKPADFALNWSTHAAEADAADFEALAAAVAVPLAGFEAAGGAFATRVALAAVVAKENDDGAAGTDDDEEDIADERLTVRLGLATGEGGRGGALFPAARDNIADLMAGGAVAELDGAGFTSAVVKITEDAAVTLALSETTLAEGDDDAGEGETTVTATAEPAQDAAFEVTVSATPGEDERWEFAGTNRTLSFVANATESTGEVKIRALHNDLDQPDLEVEVTGTAAAGVELAEGTATFTVLDDDLPVVWVSAPPWQLSDGHVFESDTGAGQWRVGRTSEDQAAELAVNLTVSESGGDFVAAADEGARTATIPAGSDRVFFGPVTADDMDEVHGTVTVAVAAGTGYEVSATSDSATADLRDDDGDLLTVTVDPEALPVPEGQPARFRVRAATVADGTFTEVGGRTVGVHTTTSDLLRLFGGSDLQNRSLTVTVATADGTATTADSDYTALASDAGAVLMFSAATVVGSGATAGLLMTADLPAVATNDDGDGDADETFAVSVGLPTDVDSRIKLGSPSTGTVTLKEGPTVTLALSDAELTEDETATATATVDPAHTAAFTVTLALETSDRYAFEGAGRTLEFAMGASSSTGAVRIRATPNEVDDGDVEGVMLTGTSSDTAVDVVAVAFKVLDDDLPKVSVAAPSRAETTGFVYEDETETGEDTGPGRWWLTREGLTDAALAVKVAVSETGGGDFVAAATEGAEQEVEFAAGLSMTSYSPVTADTTDEGHGTVTVTVADGAGYDVEGAAASASVRDDDGTLLTVGAAVEAVRAAEGNPAQVAVAGRTVADGTFTAAEHLERVLGTASLDVDAATGGGTATAGTDYTALAAGAKATLTFADFAPVGSGAAAGLELPEPAPLPAIATADDAVDDPDETFAVTLTLPSGTDGRIELDPATATVTIAEGPPDGTLRLCDAAGACVDQHGTSCAASDALCLEGATADAPLAGRVEVAWRGEYGTVCDDYWTDADAAVACRQMGHAGASAALLRSPFGGAAAGVRIWLDDVRCAGDEDRLLDCPRRGGIAPGTHNCSAKHIEDAGARCVADDAGTAAAGHPVFRLPDGAEHARAASLTAAAGSLARYAVRLSQAPADLESGYRHVRMDVSAAAPDRGVVADPSGAIWRQPEVEESDWAEFRGIVLDVPADIRAGSAVGIVHAFSRNAHPDSDYAGEYRLELAVSAADGAKTPGAPEDLAAAVASGADAQVEWSPPADAGAAPVDGYRVQTAAGSGSWERLTATDDEFVHHRDALAEASSRRYRVAAANRHGQGPWSAAARVDRPASAVAGETALTGGVEPWEGRVSVYRDGAWGRLCGDGWDLRGARAACREAGYADASQALVETSADAAPAAAAVACAGDENRLADCAAAGGGCASDARAWAVCAPAGTDGPPAPVDAAVAGSTVALRFDRPLDAGFAPAPRDFAVLSRHGGGGAEHRVASVSVAGPVLFLAVSPPVPEEARATAAYLRPALHPLRAAGGAEAAAFETPLRNAAADALPRLRAPARAAGLAAALADAGVDGGRAPVSLDASGRSLADLSGIAALAGLRELNLAGNPVADVAALAGLGELRVLDLTGNRVADLWPLAGLAGLERLALGDNAVVNVGALAALGGLRALDLSGNRVADAWPLGALERLEYLALADNAVWDARALRGLARLARLDLGGNAVADAAPLGDLDRLVWLRLSGNRVAEVDGLGRLVRLRWVWLADNPLRERPAAFLPARAWTDVAREVPAAPERNGDP